MQTNTTDVLSDDQKQMIERVYGSVILQLNIVTVIYIIRAMKGRTDTEASYYLQLLYISINDSILGALILAASLITTTDVLSASPCQVVVILLVTFNITCQVNMLSACIQRYMRAKEAFMPTQSWKTSYTHRLAISNLLFGLAIFCVFLTFASSRDSGYSSKVCVITDIVSRSIDQTITQLIAGACFFVSLFASDVLLLLTINSLRMSRRTLSEQSIASLAQRKITTTLATMAFVYNFSVLPLLINIPLRMFYGLEGSNNGRFFISLIVFSNSFFSPLIVMTRATNLTQLVINDARYVRTKVVKLFQSCFHHNRVEQAETLEL